MQTGRAVVLARGLGTRMREPDPAARLDEAQRRAADAGSKMMLPIRGRPFLDYVLSALADAGMSEIALVVAPDHQEIRAHYAAAPPSRSVLSFVVQPEPLGTANAVIAAEAWTGGEPFLAVNADNLYPPVALRSLASLTEPGLAAFERDDLVRSGNIPADRVLAFALVDVDDEGYLTGIVEKPDDLPPEGGNYRIRPERPDALPPEGGNYRIRPERPDDLLSEGGNYRIRPERPDDLPPEGGNYRIRPERPDDLPPEGGNYRIPMEKSAVSAFRRKEALVSMNCWRFDARIFDACREVPRSSRGERELPEAVALAMGRGVRFRALPARGPVLDLSRRADAADVERRLAGVTPRP